MVKTVPDPFIVVIYPLMPKGVEHRTIAKIGNRGCAL